MEEKKLNGFAIRTWSDVGIVILIASFIISGLVWGMKLESRYDTLEAGQDISHEKIKDELYDIRLLLAKGQLPRADERLTAIEKQLIKIEARDQRIEDRLSKSVK